MPSEMIAIRPHKLRPAAGFGRSPFSGALVLSVLLLASAPALPVELNVDVRGVTGEQRENVLALLGIYQEREDEALTVARLRALHRHAPDEIREALAPFGLYRVQVNDELRPPEQSDGTWTAIYQITPGDPVRIGSVDYQITGPGADDPAFPKTFPMQPGDVLLHAAYEQARDEIRTIASQQGYLDADLARHQVLIDMEAYEALVQIHLETGPRYYFGRVGFSQDLLDESLLRRYVTFDPGDPYDPERLLRLQGRLLGTEYFSKVEIVPHKELAENNAVPIEVIAEANKANKYRFGLGYATDTGARVTLEWRRRYLTRWGHKFNLELTASAPIQSLTGDYRIPIGRPTRDYIIIRPEITYYDTASKQGDVYSIQFAHSVLTEGRWRRTAGIDYRYEDYRVSEDDAAAINELVPNISWAKTVTDNPVYTTNGYRIKYTLLGAVEGVVSQASYLSGTLRLKWIKSFADDYRFITRTDLGATWANSVYDLPASRRFFAGGDNSIRGWNYDVLGPNDPETNEAVGGRYLAVGSLELERRIQGDWSAAVFTDFGNAFDPDFEKEIEVGAGIGVRWRSPIGQVRADVAFALTKEDNGARLHFSIGPDL